MQHAGVQHDEGGGDDAEAEAGAGGETVGPEGGVGDRSWLRGCSFLSCSQ